MTEKRATMWIYWVAALTPPVASLVLWFQGQMFDDLKTYGSLEWLTLLGAVLSYVGLSTSVYAVIRISELTRRSFARERLPDLLASLAVTGDQLATFSGNASDLMTENFVGAIPALARSLDRVRDKDISRLAKAARSAQHKLVKWAKRQENRERSVVQESIYWDVARILNEISVELNEKIKEERAAR